MVPGLQLALVVQFTKPLAHLAVFQAQVGHSAHWRGLALCQVLVNLVDPLSNVIVCFVEEVAAVGCELGLTTHDDKTTCRFFLISLNSSRACFDSFLAFSASFSVSASLASTSSSLGRMSNSNECIDGLPFHCLHVGSHSFDFSR